MKRDEATNTGSGVPSRADQAGAPDLTSAGWIARDIWTDRMLTALVNGVEGGKWYCLIDKIGSERALDAAWQQVRRNRGASGVDGQTTGNYDRAYRRLHPKLARQIQTGSYRVQPVRRAWIPKPGRPQERRPLGIPTVIDRVVQTATRNCLSPIFEREFHPHSYGFRPGRGAKDALHHVARAVGADRPWVVDADLSSFFDTIDHDLLMDAVGCHVSDGAVHALVRQMLEAGVMEHDAPDVCSNPTGTPQGGVISPLLANIFLNDLDHTINGAGYEMVRYADDFVILCRSQAEAETALALVRDWVADHRLTLHPEKTRIVDMRPDRSSFDFLGFTFLRTVGGKSGSQSRIVRLPRKASVAKFRDSVRRETRRNHGDSLDGIIARLNPCIRGWGQYFRSAVRGSLARLDSWVRMRLRSILRSRSKRKGRGRGRDHNRWPNAFFAERGLVSLAGIRDAWSVPD